VGLRALAGDIDLGEVDHKEVAVHKDLEVVTIKEVDGLVVHRDTGIGDLDMEVKAHTEERVDILVEDMDTVVVITMGPISK
jgi:hypothetical protein